MKQIILLFILALYLNTGTAQQTTFSSTIIAVRQSNCSVILTFSTVTEWATDQMRIERSKDGGVSYIQIGTNPGHQPANGLAGSGYSYTYTDANPFNNGVSGSGVYHYRVRTKKYDTYGPYAVSNPASVSNNNSCGLSTASVLCNGTPYYWGYGFTPGWGGSTNLCSTPIVPIEVNGITTQTIVWTSSNPNVATVNSNNFLVPLAAGYTNISASLPACNINMAANRFDICPCNGNTVPYGLGGNWSGGVCQLWFSRLGSITLYNLEYVNLNTNVTGTQQINYTGSTYAFSGLPAMTPFKWRVAATTTTACTTTGFSDWNYVVQSGSCSSSPATNLVASCVCGATAPCVINCGYERFNWATVPNAYTYQVVYQISKPSTGQVLPEQNFIISSAPPTVQPIPNYSTMTGGGWQIHFKVRAQCVDGTWQPFSTQSAEFGL